MPRLMTAGFALALAAAGGCSSAPSAPDAAAVAAPTRDAATRSSPVVVGRPARVFVFAGVGKNCEAAPAPVITVTAPPAQGELSFRPGQETTLQTSLGGTCVGQRAVGTGVYYTARPGAKGSDRFAVEARFAGEVANRAFEVRIEE